MAENTRTVANKVRRRIHGKISKYSDDIKYKKWISLRQLPATTQAPLRYQPLFSIIVPTYNTNPNHLKSMIGSVQDQSYKKWELILVDDASPSKKTKKQIIDIAARDARIRYKFLDSNLGISGATNVGIGIARGEFISLLDHDDILKKNALAEIVSELNNNQNVDFIYTNEDKINKSSSSIHQPFFKPSWSPDFLYSVNYITHFATIRKTILEEVGLLSSEHNGAQDWELFLRLGRHLPAEKIRHIDNILYSWRVHEESTAKRIDSKPYVVEAQRRAIEGDLQQRGIKNFRLSQDSQYPGQWQVKFEPISSPRVTICVCGELSEKLIDYIRKHTEYLDYDVISINKLCTYRELFNNVTGRFVVIVYSQDIQIASPDWLSDLVGDAQREDIGCVVARQSSEREVVKQLHSILSRPALSVVERLSDQNISKHLYLTSRYNIKTVYSGVFMVEVNKLGLLSQSKDIFDIQVISNHLVNTGYRNLYNPYIKVLK